MDLYEFFHSCYVDTPKKKLLEIMAHHDKIAELHELPQRDLKKSYAYELVATVFEDAPAPAPPTRHKRLRLSSTRK